MSDAQQGGGDGPDQQQITATQEVDAARALEVVSMILADDKGPREFYDDPRAAFGRKQVELTEPSLKAASYDDIPARSRAALEGLSIPELRVLAKLNQTFIDDGLYVDVPSPGKLFYH